MLLSQTAEYAVRLMFQLSRCPWGERQRAVDLAAAAGIPSAYVSKVLARLVHAQLVDGLKGHHGGFVLARRATDITMEEILGAVEDWHDLDRRCFYGYDRCRPAEPCPLHDSFATLKSATCQWAREVRLSDFTPVDRRESPPAVRGASPTTPR